VIARLWHGWASPENADDYEALLRAGVLPGLERIDGYRGAYLLRRSAAEGIEFTTITLWASMEAVRAFAGDDVEAAVVPPEAQRLLSSFDDRSVHYEIVIEPSQTR
jgi:heme-degrading monooxygenase HmoA